MKNTSFYISILPICLLLSGCGTDEYQSRLDRGVSSQSSGSKFTSILGAETTIPGTKVSLRIPNVMQSVDINDPVHGKFPLWFDLPGLKATYEGSIEDQINNKMHYYLYVSVSDQSGDKIPTQGWMNELRQKFPKAGDDSSNEVNKNYSAGTPEGGAVVWEEIHFKKCDQKFCYSKADNPQNVQDMLGNMVILCHAENNIVVTLIFRYPESLENLHGANFDSEWINLIAGCVKVGS
jgi:hypothetical protein